MTVDEAIKTVEVRASGRTRYMDQEPFLDEVLVGEIERLRKELVKAMEAVTAVVEAFESQMDCQLARDERVALHSCRMIYKQKRKDGVT
jgi:hypothetical protein